MASWSTKFYLKFLTEINPNYPSLQNLPKQCIHPVGSSLNSSLSRIYVVIEFSTLHVLHFTAGSSFNHLAHYICVNIFITELHLIQINSLICSSDTFSNMDMSDLMVIHMKSYLDVRPLQFFLWLLCFLFVLKSSQSQYNISVKAWQLLKHLFLF